MGGVNFDDEVEPWRAGGDNSRMGQPVIRYGPCKPSVSQAQISRTQSFLANCERKRFYEQLMDLFFDPTIPIEQKIEPFQKNLMAPVSLFFQEFGLIPYRKSGMGYFWRKRNQFPKTVFDFIGEDLVILQRNHDFWDVEIKRWPIRGIRFSIQSKLEENKELHDHTIHVHFDKNYPANASLNSCAL